MFPMTVHRAVGVDIGGTDTKIGLVRFEGDSDSLRCAKFEIETRLKIPTVADRGPEAVVDDIAAAVASLKPPPIMGIGVGCPGPLSPSRGVVFGSPNLAGWRDVPLRDLIAERTHQPTVIDNDANLAALGEYCASPDSPGDLVLMTLGTGIGTGTIIDGRVFHGQFENASEWGHTIVQPGGLPCPCGQCGCLEQYASATAVVGRYTQLARDSDDSSVRPTVTAADVARLAASGDKVAGEVWDDACRFLATVCVNIQHAVNPGRVLLGGGMSAAGAFLLSRVVRHFDALRWRVHDDFPVIGLSRLGNDAGIVGAARLAVSGADH
jgi:glucokinase